MTTILNNMQCKKYNINISYHSCIFYINDKNVAPGGNPECSKNIFFLQKWVDFFYFILLLPKIKESMLRMKYRQNRFAAYFEKHSGVAKCHSGPKTRRLPKFEIDSIKGKSNPTLKVLDQITLENKCCLHFKMR